MEKKQSSSSALLFSVISIAEQLLWCTGFEVVSAGRELFPIVGIGGKLRNEAKPFILAVALNV